MLLGVDTLALSRVRSARPEVARVERSGKQLEHLVVAGLTELRYQIPTATNRGGVEQADDLVGQLPEPCSTGIGRADGYREDEPVAARAVARPAAPRSAVTSGGQAVIDDDDVPTAERRNRPPGAIRR